MKEVTINLPGGKKQVVEVPDVPLPTTPISKPDVSTLDLSDQGLTDEFLATKPLLKYVTDEQGWVGYLDGLWLPKLPGPGGIHSLRRVVEVGCSVYRTIETYIRRPLDLARAAKERQMILM